MEPGGLNRRGPASLQQSILCLEVFAMRSLLLTLVVVAAISPWQPSSAQAQNGPSSLQLTIDGPSTITLGEPIWLDIAIVNRSVGAIRIDLGDDAIRNIVVTLQAEHGKPLRRELPLSEGVRGPGQFVVGVGEQYSQTILLGKWHDVPAPGTNKVTIEFAVDALDTRGLAVRMPSGAITIPVLPRDESVLEKVYSELRLAEDAKWSSPDSS
jgi:hypothetical protein